MTTTSRPIRNKKVDFTWNRRTLGEFFRRGRLSTGLSIEQAAVELDVGDPSLLQAFEDGTMPIPLEMVFSMTNLYNIAPEETLLMMFELHGG